VEKNEELFLSIVVAKIPKLISANHFTDITHRGIVWVEKKSLIGRHKRTVGKKTTPQEKLKENYCECKD
jgi:hypothetical protein